MSAYLPEILEVLRRTRGIDLAGYRQGTLSRRVASRRNQLGIAEAALYLRRLQDDPKEADRLLESLMIHVSWFFRQPPVFDRLAGQVLPSLMAARQRSGSQELRCWSAGCATGEEAYSLAVLLHQALERSGRMWQARIFGTDIDASAIDGAALGRYGRDRLREVRLGVLDRYFVERDGCYEVTGELKNMVRFSVDDLVGKQAFSPAESVFGSFDLVLCRNVMIYFDELLRDRVLAKLVRALEPGGYLVLGDAEAPDGEVAEKLSVVDPACRIYRKREAA